MKRRGFLALLGAVPGLGALSGAPGHRGSGAPDPWCAGASVPPYASSLLVPMDDAQTNHLKAYGIAYAAIARAGLPPP